MTKKINLLICGKKNLENNLKVEKKNLYICMYYSIIVLTIPCVDRNLSQSFKRLTTSSDIKVSQYEYFILL